MRHSDSPHEREQARACSCPSCRKKYGLPPKDSTAGIPGGALGIVAAAALAIGAAVVLQKLEDLRGSSAEL